MAELGGSELCVLDSGAGFFSKPSLKSRNTIFTVGQRGAVLSPAELEGPILIPHTAQRGDVRVRMMHLHLQQQKRVKCTEMHTKTCNLNRGVETFL